MTDVSRDLNVHGAPTMPRVSVGLAARLPEAWAAAPAPQPPATAKAAVSAELDRLQEAVSGCESALKLKERELQEAQLALEEKLLQQVATKAENHTSRGPQRQSCRATAADSPQALRTVVVL